MMPVRQTTIDLLLRYRKDIGYSVPITDDDIPSIRDWFLDKEIELSQDDDEKHLTGSDRELLENVSNAFDDFHPLNNDELVDLDDLNRRLGEAVNATKS